MAKEPENLVVSSLKDRLPSLHGISDNTIKRNFQAIPNTGMIVKSVNKASNRNENLNLIIDKMVKLSAVAILAALGSFAISTVVDSKNILARGIAAFGFLAVSVVANTIILCINPKKKDNNRFITQGNEVIEERQGRSKS